MAYFGSKKNTHTTFAEKAGFTIVEMLVAVFVFSIIMTISVGAVFMLISANKSSQALKSVMDNLSSALDSMSRNTRFGQAYHCGLSGDLSEPYSCPGGDNAFAFLDKEGVQVIYKFEPDASPSTDGSIYKCIDNTDPANCTRLTAPEVHIKSLNFYVSGAGIAESSQPKVIITVSGYAKSGPHESKFNIETLVSQRKLECKQVMIDFGIDCQS